eukprot:scaffold1834_cov175-Amphora_coffeaeformis.AAC.12
MSTPSSRIKNNRKAFSIKLAPLKEITLSSSSDVKPSSRPPLCSVSNNHDGLGFDQTSLKNNSSLVLPDANKESPVTYTRSEQLKAGQRGLLRYGERLEDLFGIPQSVPWDDAYYQKCRQLQSLEENAMPQQEDRCQLWRDILQDARQQSTLTGSSLIRLHRRATSRLPWEQDSQSSLLLDVWLSYVRVQMEHCSLSDAQLTLRHLRATRFAAYYAALVELEEKMGKSESEIIELLQSAVLQRAQPIEIIERALRERGVSGTFSSTGTFPTAKRNHVEEIQPSPKRLKTVPDHTNQMSMSSNQPDIVTETNDLDDSNMSLDDDEEDNSETIKWKTTANKNKQLEKGQPMVQTDCKNVLRCDAESMPGRSCSEVDRTIDIPYTDKGTFSHHQVAATPSESITVRKPFTDASTNFSLRSSETKKTPMRPGIALSKVPNSHSVVSRQRRPLIGKLPRLTKLSGKAQRVDPNQSVLLQDQEDSIDDSHGSSEMQSTTSSTKKDKPSLSKIDLSYIFEWDPNKRLSEQKVSLSTESPLRHKTQKCKSKDDEKHDEKRRSKNVLEDTAPTDKTDHPRETQNAMQKEESTTAESPSEVPTAETTKNTTSVSLSGINADFLPLVNETNILRVNGVPYAKLGVVGKGGSCKVYRALSKDCTVVAIKKVKTSGLDRKNIESYANEIKLLKSLRGNPAIIQMFDSQVDLKRKAIYVVMEVGEVDLNHILHQQSLLVDSPDGRKRLNMNFIRLTWFQMLTAVHSIHEERIIHGDLKPANFLFVRGALKLIDFGIAKAMQTDDTTNIYRENQVGTLNYMSPEAITGSGDPEKPKLKLGRASDIWSLGCILYQLVYGKTPFAHLQMFPKLAAICNPNHKIDFPGDAEEAAVDAIKACLHRNPDDRLPIVGDGGLLNEHIFLNPRKQKKND